MKYFEDCDGPLGGANPLRNRSVVRPRYDRFEQPPDHLITLTACTPSIALQPRSQATAAAMKNRRAAPVTVAVGFCPIPPCDDRSWNGKRGCLYPPAAGAQSSGGKNCCCSTSGRETRKGGHL